MRHIFVYIFSFFFITSCNFDVKNDLQDSGQPLVVSKADSVNNAFAKAHGVSVFNSHKFSFVFRNKKYSFNYGIDNPVYTRSDSADWRFIEDFCQGDEFRREINGEVEEVSEIDKKRYQSSINSVIYFATLPYKLSDEGVISNYKGRQKIKMQNYDVVEVSFKEEGGGEDYQDIFYYWFNSKTHFIDYFAYQYETNGGGVRFREAINQVKVAGAVFQDYVNYEVSVGTLLKDIPEIFEMDSLKELSLIENKYIMIN